MKSGEWLGVFFFVGFLGIFGCLFHPLTPKAILNVILVKLQNVREEEEIKSYPVQPTQFTDWEIEMYTTEWDRRTVQRCQNEVVSGRF